MPLNIAVALGTYTWQTVVCHLQFGVMGYALPELLQSMKDSGKITGNLNYLGQPASGTYGVQIGHGMYSWIIKDPLTPFNDYALLTNKRYSAFALMHFSSQIDPQDLYGNNTTQLDFHEQLQLMWEFAESLASEAYQFALARM